MRSDRWYPGSSGYVPYAGVPSNGCDQRCSYWYCIRAGSNRSAPGHQTLTPVANQVKTGWQQEDSGWRFYSRDGSGKHVTNAWYEDNGKWYWFDGAGKMVHDVWYQYKGSWYYLGSDGAMVKGLQTIGGKWYYMDTEGRMATKPVVLTPDQNGALKYPGLSQ